MINLTQEEINKSLLSLHLLKENIPEKQQLKILYTISNRIEKNYKVYKIKKKKGGYRRIYSPSPILKQIQKNILNNILNEHQISKYAKAYHKGICLQENAYPHVNKRIILKLDIIDFFENIEYYAIYKTCFANFRGSIGHLLTYLCTYESRLPQGAPTSAYISNLVMRQFDEEVGTWCEEKKITYTRYSDDMTFSGDFNPSEVISFVRKKLYPLNLKLNNKKINVISHAQQQKVTGLVVNEKVQVATKYRKKIRQEIYYIKKFGIEDHLKRISYPKSIKNYLNELYGKILYVLSIDKENKEFINYKEYLIKIKESVQK